MSPAYPTPELTRWQPLRSGLLNLYRYDREEFWFEKGRLLLRGNNGTGKSRVLALQFPFLLDGEISSRRVEPDADPAKRMEWNVLTDRHDNRTGYTWLEFGRLSPDGPPEYCTIGCGLHATRGKGAPTRWFFVTRHRIGETLFLEGPGQVPLTREQLREALGDLGTVFTTARDYRRAVNEALYQLDEERYEALVELLIQLRQPQLSRQLDENKLSDALSYSLAPLEESVIHSVAESFKQLEEERVALDNDLRAVESVARFQRTYSRYAERQVSEQIAELLEHQLLYEKAVKARNSAREALTAAETAHQEALEAFKACDQQVIALETRRDTLNARPELQDAARLTRAHEEARKARRGLEIADTDLAKSQNTLKMRQNALTEAQQSLEHARGLCERTRQSVQEYSHDLIAPREWQDWQNITDAPDALTKRVHAWTSDRRDALAALKKLSRDITEAVQRELRAQDAASRQRERWERAEEAAALKRTAQTRCIEEHLQALHDWRDTLRILTLSDPEALERAEELWCETLEGPPPLRTALQQAESLARGHLAQKEAQLQQQHERLVRETETLQTERDTLARGIDPEPAPPRFRKTEARNRQPGAPLWRLLEFQPDLPPAECAAIEAALEAAGLLDAWLTPDGTLLENSHGDLLIDLLTLPPVSGPNATTFLQADSAANEVDPEILQKLLTGIGIEKGKGSLWITSTGHWHQGALTGEAEKPHAEYLGASARAQARQRRITVLDQLLTETAEAKARIVRQQQTLAAHRATLNTEVGTCPDPSPVQHAARDVQSTRDQAEREHNERVECDQKALEARESVRTKRETLRVTAEDLRLGAWTERLDALEATLQTLQDQLQYWLRAVDRAEHARIDTHRSKNERDHAEAELQRAEERAAHAQAASLRLKTEVETLDANVGKGIREVQQQLELTKHQLETTQTQKQALDDQERKLNGILYQRQADLDQKEATLTKDTDARDRQRDAFLDRTATGILDELEGASPPRESLNTLSLTALIEWIRDLARRLPEPSQDPDSMDRLRRELYQAFQSLSGDLSARNLHPVTEPRHGLDLVFCEYQGKSRGMRELHVILHEETLHRQGILKAREKEFIERYLIDDIGDRLHHMILNAEELIRNMNAEMESRPMSTGLKLRLVWEPAADAPEGFREARKRLQRSKALLTAADRQQLGDFLQERITREKEENEGGTWREHLARAVDYRRWHRFGVERHQGGTWQKLTRRTHGTGSGGEKAVALTFPQFAAAAAHYHNLPHAPRLIFLDEAFVGIDSDMRGKCMGLLEHFDLDFVMTSEREWGCYASIRGLAICQLAAMSGTDVVAISRWIWNGHARESAASPDPARPPVEAPEAEEDLFSTDQSS